MAKRSSDSLLGVFIGKKRKEKKRSGWLLGSFYWEEKEREKEKLVDEISHFLSKFQISLKAI